MYYIQIGMYVYVFRYVCVFVYIFMDTGEILCASESAAKCTFVIFRYLSVQHDTKHSQQVCIQDCQVC